MTKKRCYLISAGILTACVCLVFAVLAILPPRPGVTKANFRQIKFGMAMTEVEAIFGEAGIYAPITVWVPENELARTEITVFWNAHDGSATIVFVNNNVTGRTWTEFTETIPDKLRRWLNLPV